MNSIARVILSLAVAASMTSFAGCEGDQSAPTHPRRGLGTMENEKSRENAERRELEKPQRDLPATGGKEFPGQSAAPARGDAQVITADARRASHGALDAPIPVNGSDQVLPQSRYDRAQRFYHGPLPMLPDNPGSVPMIGATEVPYTEMSVEYSWGQGLVLENYPHRNWPDTQTQYVAANVKHNPVYFFDLQEQLPVPQNNGTYGGDWVSNLYEWPWFYLNSAAFVPFMFVECPWSQVTTQRLGKDPNYFGHLPATGAFVAAPEPGDIQWRYPFLEQSYRGTRGNLSTQPFLPIPPTPGVVAAPPATRPAATRPSPTEPMTQP
jgi:hypothetical protein